MYVRFRLTRHVRTETSEIYILWAEENQIGGLQLHYAGETVYAEGVFVLDLSGTSEEELLAQIGEDVVNPYLPPMDRADFIQYVFRGELIASHSESEYQADHLEIEDEEE